MSSAHAGPENDFRDEARGLFRQLMADARRERRRILVDYLGALVEAYAAEVGPAAARATLANLSQALDPSAVVPLPVARPVDLDVLARQVAALHGASVEQLRGRSRLARVCAARQHFMHSAYTSGRYAHAEIGEWLNGRDHTTVIHGVQRHAARLAGLSTDRRGRGIKRNGEI